MAGLWEVVRLPIALVIMNEWFDTRVADAPPPFPRGAEVAVVEDNPEVARLVGRKLSEAGLRPHLLQSGRELDECLRQTTTRIIVLDIGLPGEDGLSIARRLADKPEYHVIMLTGRGAATDRLAGFEAGADYYYEKPANLRELVAVIRRIDRRLQQPTTAWTIERHRRRLLSPEGTQVALTDQEGRFLWLLGQAPERALTRESLEMALWQKSDAQTARRLEVMIHRFRRKLVLAGLAEDPIQTRWRTGYGFGPPLAMVSGEEAGEK